MEHVDGKNESLGGVSRSQSIATADCKPFDPIKYNSSRSPLAAGAAGIGKRADTCPRAGRRSFVQPPVVATIRSSTCLKEFVASCLQDYFPNKYGL